MSSFRRRNLAVLFVLFVPAVLIAKQINTDLSPVDAPLRYTKFSIADFDAARQKHDLVVVYLFLGNDNTGVQMWREVVKSKKIASLIRAKNIAFFAAETSQGDGYQFYQELMERGYGGATPKIVVFRKSMKRPVVVTHGYIPSEKVESEFLLSIQSAIDSTGTYMVTTVK